MSNIDPLKFADLSLDDLEVAIDMFQEIQSRSPNIAFGQQIDELRKELAHRRGPLTEKVLIKG